ncbi:MAG: hypothetical protein QW818_00295 [Candidatus Aenigmatarchaeota archaeon]|nr:hypothetical protein [Candidatus Aenigmarchaeota archaeon]
MSRIDALEIIKQSFWISFRHPIIFTLVLPLVVSMITVLISIFVLFFSLYPTNLFLIFTSLVLLLFSFWLGMLSAGSIILFVEKIYKHRKVRFWDVLNKSFENSLRLIIAYSLEQLFLMLGFLFFVIPGIFLTVKLSLVVPGCILEKKGFGIKRSWNATKNNFWKIFLILVIWNVLFMVFGFIPYLSILTIFLIPVYLTTLTLLYIRLR